MSRDLKYSKELVEIRRGRVFELSSQGYSQRDIATMMGVSIGLVNSDLQYMRAKSRESFHKCIDSQLPEEYSKCLSGLNSILKESWTVAYKTQENREKIQALSLAKECYNAKLELLTNTGVLEDLVKFINKSKSAESPEPEPQTQIEQEPSPVSESEPVQDMEPQDE
jgi:predicted transcriptional regulator